MSSAYDDMADSMSSAAGGGGNLIGNNPTTQASGSVGDFFGFLGKALGTAGGVALTDWEAEQQAKSAARQQQLLNQYHAVNPSLGPNDPNAAQNAADRTFLERYLPSSVLYTTDPVSKVQRFSPVYWVILLLLIGGLVYMVRRIFRR